MSPLHRTLSRLLARKTTTELQRARARTEGSVAQCAAEANCSDSLAHNTPSLRPPDSAPLPRPTTARQNTTTAQHQRAMRYTSTTRTQSTAIFLIFLIIDLMCFCLCFCAKVKAVVQAEEKFALKRLRQRKQFPCRLSSPAGRLSHKVGWLVGWLVGLGGRWVDYFVCVGGSVGR